MKLRATHIQTSVRVANPVSTFSLRESQPRVCRWDFFLSCAARPRNVVSRPVHTPVFSFARRFAQSLSISLVRRRYSRRHALCHQFPRGVRFGEGAVWPGLGRSHCRSLSEVRVHNDETRRLADSFGRRVGAPCYLCFLGNRSVNVNRERPQGGQVRHPLARIPRRRCRDWSHYGWHSASKEQIAGRSATPLDV
jgi:hypothetical protein